MINQFYYAFIIVPYMYYPETWSLLFKKVENIHKLEWRIAKLFRIVSSQLSILGG
jgi:hypothetical protein